MTLIHQLLMSFMVHDRLRGNIFCRAKSHTPPPSVLGYLTFYEVMHSWGIVYECWKYDCNLYLALDVMVVFVHIEILYRRRVGEERKEGGGGLRLIDHIQAGSKYSYIHCTSDIYMYHHPSQDKIQCFAIVRLVSHDVERRLLWHVHMYIILKKISGDQ